MIIIGFDLDGVLAEGPPPNVKKWGLMKRDERHARKAFLVQHYAQARLLYKPPAECQFHVITARKNEDDVKIVTKQWLLGHFGSQILGVHMLNGSRSVENAGAFKYNVIKELGITHFYEDNVKVLKVIRKHMRKDNYPLNLQVVTFDAAGNIVVNPLD